MKNVGTMSIGVRTGVIKEGDNLAENHSKQCT